MFVMSTFKQIALAIFLLAAPIVSFSGTSEAVNVLQVCNRKPNAAVCKDKKANGNPNPIYGKDGILTEAINIVSILIGVAAVIMIIIGGLKMITSGSNPQDVTSARETIIYAVVGLIVASSAQLLVRFVLSKL